MTPVRESQVEDLVTVFFQRLNLHTGDTVKQAPELSVPRHGRCTKTQQELVKSSISLSIHTELLPEISAMKNCRVPSVKHVIGILYLGVGVQSAVSGSICRTAPSKGTHLWTQPATVCRSGQRSARHHGADAGRSPTPGYPAELGHTPS